jgi:hypothetical protein
MATTTDRQAPPSEDDSIDITSVLGSMRQAPEHPAHDMWRDPDAQDEPVAAAPVGGQGLKLPRLRGKQIKVEPRNKWRSTNGNPPKSRKGVYDPQSGWLVESTGEPAPGGGVYCTVYCPGCDHGVIYGDAEYPPGSPCPGDRGRCRELIPRINFS